MSFPTSKEIDMRKMIALETIATQLALQNKVLVTLTFTLVDTSPTMRDSSTKRSMIDHLKKAFKVIGVI